MPSEHRHPSADSSDHSDDDELFTIPRQRKASEEELDITPMIDITFLLLIFFLVAARINPDQAVTLPEARHGFAVSATDSVVVLVLKGTADQAIVARQDGTQFPGGDLTEQEDAITEYVAAGLNGVPPFDAPKQHILIKAERGVRHGEVRRVAQAAGRAGEEERKLHIGVMDVH